MRTLQSVGLVLLYISIETLSWVTQLKIGDICLCIYNYVCGCTCVILYFDPHVFVFALWSTLPIPPLN